MNTRRKIFTSLIAMISIVSFILLLFIILNTGRVRRSGGSLLENVDGNIRNNVEQELLTLAGKMSSFTLALEAEIEGNMRNAANAVFEADRLSGFSLTLEDLQVLRERTGMSDLYLGGPDGIFTLSTEPGGAGVALFEIWEGYRMLVTGEADFMASDLSMKVETGEVFKFALIPRADGMGIIESALEAGAVEMHLQSFLESNHGIRTMNLIAENLLVLTENSMQGVQPEYAKGEQIPSRDMMLGSFFDGSSDYSIIFDEEKAQIYYPVFDGARTRYVLFIDMDTTSFFELREHIGEAMEEQVQQTTTFNAMSLMVVLAVLLIFTIFIIFLINRIMQSYEEQYEKIEERNKAVMDNENLVRYHTIILLCVGIFFAIVQGFQYGTFAAMVIISSVTLLAAFMFMMRRRVPLNIRIHIVSNGSFFVALGCSMAISSTPDMFGLFLSCVIVGSLYFRRSVIIGMAITVNTAIIVCILLLRLGLPEDFEFTNMWFINNMAGLNCGIALLYAVSSIGKGFIDSIAQKSEETEKLLGKVREQNKTIVEGIGYASKIQRSLLPPESAMAELFEDYSVIWKPRDIVGGDIYWIKHFDAGTVLCLADCTGHGTPGALLTTLVTSALESVVWDGNYFDTADIMWQLDRRLTSVLHVENRRGIMDIDDGCDAVVMYIAKDGAIEFSSGKIPVFACDGKEVTQYKGQKIFIGEGKLKSAEDVTVHKIKADPGIKIYIASDGMADQKGGELGRQFGYTEFKKIILDNHGKKLSEITDVVWGAFERYRGKEEQRDDFELVAFVPKAGNRE